MEEMKMKCKNCKDLIDEIEELRTELTELSGVYSAIAEKLYQISQKKRDGCKEIVNVSQSLKLPSDLIKEEYGVDINYKCPKCNYTEKNQTFRSIGKNIIYDCPNCKDQIAFEALIKNEM